MLNNKKFILVYFIIAMMIAYIEFSTTSKDAYTKPLKTKLILDKSKFESYTKQYDIDDNLDKQWDVYEKKKVQKKKLEQTVQKTNDITQPKDKNILCINESCYRLVGIYNEKDKSFITLFNKNNEKKLKTYHKNMIIESLLKITMITTNSVEFRELNTTNKWYFRLFDVNQTKYKPRKIK